MKSNREISISIQRHLRDAGIVTDAIFDIPFPVGHGSLSQIKELAEFFEMWLCNHGINDLKAEGLIGVSRNQATTAPGDKLGGVVVFNLPDCQDLLAMRVQRQIEFWVEEGRWPNVRVVYYEPGNHASARVIAEEHGRLIDVKRLYGRAMEIRGDRKILS